MLCAVCCVLCASERELVAQVAPLGALEDRFGCEADRIHEGVGVNAHMGHTLAAGDWNGDGIDDLLTAGLITSLGECECTPSAAPDVGRVWLHLGNSTHTALQPAIEFTNIRSMDDFGPPIAFIGDINNDGGDDIAIGLPTFYHHSPGDNSGAVWIFLSEVPVDPDPSDPTDPLYPFPPKTISLTSAATVPDIVINPPPGEFDPGDEPHFGFSIAAAGHVNDDPWPDLVIGAPGPATAPELLPTDVCGTSNPRIPGEGSPIPTPLGRAFIFSGNDPTISEWPVVAFDHWATLSGLDGDPLAARGGPADRFGWEVAGVGDVNGDDLDDVVVGAVQASATGLDLHPFDSGFAHLYLGQDLAAALPAHELSPVLIEPTALDGDRAWGFGHVVVGGVILAGDTNHDILISAPFYNDQQDGDVGAVYAYTWDSTAGTLIDAFSNRQPILLPTALPTVAEPYLDPAANLGWALSSLGDYDSNADPVTPAEFLVGAIRNNNTTDFPCSGPAQGGRLSGRAFIVHVDPAFPNNITVQCVYKGEEATKSRLGTSVAAGDFDGDGLLDVAAGGSGYGLNAQEFGRLYVFSNFEATP